MPGYENFELDTNIVCGITRFGSRLNRSGDSFAVKTINRSYNASTGIVTVSWNVPNASGGGALAFIVVVAPNGFK